MFSSIATAATAAAATTREVGKQALAAAAFCLNWGGKSYYNTSYSIPFQVLMTEIMLNIENHSSEECPRW